MARTQEPQAETPKAPDFIAYDVLTRGEKRFWNRVGAAWLHNDGNGMTVLLQVLGITFRIVLRAPREETQEPAAA